MAEYQVITGSEWKKSLLYIIPPVLIVVIGSIFLLPHNWMWYLVLVAFSIGVVIILAVREEKNVMFKCPTCGQEFEISAFQSALSPHGVTKKDDKWIEWKQLECPMCHTKEKMFPIKNK